MKRKHGPANWIAALLMLFALVPCRAAAGDVIHVLYDSETREEGLQTGWGYAALVKRGSVRVLVDAGWKEHIFKHNFEKTGYSPAQIDYVVISHWHPDHTGGLRYLLEKNPEIKVFVPSDFRSPADKEWRLERVKGHTAINEGLFVFQTNPDKEYYGIAEELTLAIKTGRGPVILSGCFHTGWPDIIKKVGEVIPGNPYFMTGGGRFIDLTKTQLEALAGELKGLRLQKIGLAHCAAGDLPDRVFGGVYGKDSIYSRLGAIIPLPE